LASALDFRLHLAPKVLLRKASGGSCSGPILTTLDFVLPFGGVRGLNKGGCRGGLLFRGSAVSPLIGSRFTLETLSYDDLPSGSTGKLKKSLHGVGSADCQRLSFPCDFHLVPLCGLSLIILSLVLDLFVFGSPISGDRRGGRVKGIESLCLY